MSVAHIMYRLSHLHLGEKFFTIKCPPKLDRTQKDKFAKAEELLLDDYTSEAASISFTQLDSKPFDEEDE